MKTEVKVIEDKLPKDGLYSTGDIGYVDGYVSNGQFGTSAIVIFYKTNIITEVPLKFLKKIVIEPDTPYCDW